MLDEKILAGIDENIRDLVIALNKIPGIKTHASCEGHDGGYSPHFSGVGFTAKNMRSLKRLARKIFPTDVATGVPFTEHKTKTWERIDGYWIEVRYDPFSCRPFFALEIYSSNKETRMEWIRIIIERLEA